MDIIPLLFILAGVHYGHSERISVSKFASTPLSLSVLLHCLLLPDLLLLLLLLLLLFLLLLLLWTWQAKGRGI